MNEREAAGCKVLIGGGGTEKAAGKSEKIASQKKIHLKVFIRKIGSKVSALISLDKK